MAAKHARSLGVADDVMREQETNADSTHEHGTLSS